MTTTTYEGWNNYETWTVALWIDGDSKSHAYSREQAAEHREAAPTCDMVVQGVWTIEEAARINLAEKIKESIVDAAPQMRSTVYNDLLHAAFDEVQWQDIADHLLESIGERDDDASDFFGPVISAYSRAQAIADGVLIDISKMANEAGIKYPTAVTSAVWHEFVEVPEGVDGQDEPGRLWDILNMYRFAAKCSTGGSELLFDVLVRNDNTTPKLVNLKAICGPGDTPDPVITIMQPDED